MSTETDDGRSTSYMSIQVTDLPATAELILYLITPGYTWTSDAKGLHAGVSLMGQQYAALSLAATNLTTNMLTLIVGDEMCSFSIGIPISYPSGTRNPTARGTLTINNPTDQTTVFLTAGGPPQQVGINEPWHVPIMPIM